MWFTKIGAVVDLFAGIFRGSVTFSRRAGSIFRTLNLSLGNASVMKREFRVKPLRFQDIWAYQ